MRNEVKKMAKKCGFCKAEIDERAIEVCDRCGEGIWGPKMFAAIKKNMETAENRGDLNQGSVTDDPRVARRAA